MRILVDVEESHLRELDHLALRERQSRAGMIRQAIAEYLDRRTQQTLEEAFGLWGDRKIDGLSWQQKIRSEEW